MYEVQTTPEGLRHLQRLPAKTRAAAVEAILGPVAENPRRAGKALAGELQGLYSARRGDYRIIYEILDQEQVVIVHRVQHRGLVHRKR